jgi:hypothetical protein
MDARALGSLEEIAEQASFHVNPKTRKNNTGRRWGVSPNFEHSKVAREKKPQQPKPAVTKPPPTPAAAPTPAKLGRAFSDYRTLVEICRARADELELSRSELDRLSGLPAGYSSKLHGRDGAERRGKKMWPFSLEAMLGVLGVRIVLIEDDAATARTLALRVPVDRSQQRFGNVSRIGDRQALDSCAEQEATAA